LLALLGAHHILHISKIRVKRSTQSKNKRLYMQEGERRRKIKGNRRISTAVSTGR
jgi:hypothetical protein